MVIKRVAMANDGGYMMGYMPGFVRQGGDGGSTISNEKIFNEKTLSSANNCIFFIVFHSY